jgi:hypothetical protein
LGPDPITAAIARLSGPDPQRIRGAVERRDRQLGKQSTVVHRRNHGRGILQLEYRANPNTGTQRGPYWYFYSRLHPEQPAPRLLSLYLDQF